MLSFTTEQFESEIMNDTMNDEGLDSGISKFLFLVY